MTPTPKVANLEEAGTVNRDQTPENGRSVHHAAEWREGLLRCLLIAIFLLFFQAYMVAPLIPYLAEQFGVTREAVGRMVPAYLLPYALGAIVYVNRRRARR